MSFLNRLKDVMSVRIAKSNRLIGNHALRICEKLETNATPLFSALVVGTSVCTIEFLEAIVFDVKDFRYGDGTEEPNPFKENLHLLNAKNSYVMFKLVAGNYLVNLLARGYIESVKYLVDISELKNQFFAIYEYNDEDIKIFNELIKLAQKDERPSPEIRLYDYIFERAYNIEIPEFLFHIMNFEALFATSLNEVFLPGLLESLEQQR